MLEQMEIFEQAERDIGERAPEIEKLRGEMDARFKIFEEETRAQGARVEELRAERERLAASLPKNLAAMYNRINARIRDGVAVAEARNNSCTACRMSLRPQVMTEIRRGEDIIICDNCNRILYYRGAGHQQAQAAS